MSRRDNDTDDDLLDEDEVDEDGDETDDTTPDGPPDPIFAHLDHIGDRVSDLAEDRLKARLGGLEADRLKVRRFITRGATVMAIPIVLFLFGNVITAVLATLVGSLPIVHYLSIYGLPITIAIGVLCLAYVVTALVMPGITAHLNYRRRYKHEVLAELFTALVPDGRYEPDQHLTQEVVNESGLFPKKLGTFKGDDLIRGRSGGAEFEASEIQAAGQITVSRGKKRQQQMSRPNVTEFHGLFYHIGLRTAFKGHIIIEPEEADGRFFRHRSDFAQVTFGDDEAFTEQFRVYASDEAEARRLLTAQVRTRLVKVAIALPRVPFFAFKGQHVYMAVHQGKGLLEPTVAKPVGYSLLVEAGEYFTWPELLIATFGLGTPTPFMTTTASVAGGDSAHTAGTHAFATPTFGTAAFGTAAFGTPAFGSAGGSILSQPAARSSFGSVDPSKALTFEGVMDAAIPQADEKDLSLPRPPESRVRMSPMTGESLEISYGFGGSIVRRLLWLLVLTPFALAGLAHLAGPSAASIHQMLTDQLPLALSVMGWVIEAPIIFGVVVLLFYVLPLLGLRHLVRALRIDRQGVRISKWFWPFATHYPLDRIAAVQVNDAQVILAKTRVPLLWRFVNPAPPMRSTEDARWLAAHIRRALTTFGGLRG